MRRALDDALLAVLVALLAIETSGDPVSIYFNTSSLDIARGATGVISLTTNDSVLVVFDTRTKVWTLNAGQGNISVNGSTRLLVTGHSIGEADLSITSCLLASSLHPCDNASYANKSSRIRVIRTSWLARTSDIFGWIEFVAWSISFYPQIILNFRRRSVIGLSFDFLTLNIFGFTCYSIFNFVLYYNTAVKDLYLRENPRSQIPVQMNDVIFAAHALAASLFTGAQCLVFQRGNQRVSHTCKGFHALFLLYSLTCLIVTLFHKINWLMFINLLSYVKMAVSLLKYCPQAYFNYKRKSTVGWSIGNVLLDLTGGLFSLLQTALDIFNTGDWTLITNNLVKFGLGLSSLVFDSLFIVQHYVWYGDVESSYDGIDNLAVDSSSDPSGIQGASGREED